jgi:predicted phosphodiesterase
MKIQILSDLHIEFENFDFPQTEADVIVLAGDIHLGVKGVLWAKNVIQKQPVIYVLGNHEYYRNAYPKLLGKIKKETEGTNINILENQKTKIDGVIFLGCSLWTDFKLFGNPKIAGIKATQRMTDYTLIRISPQYRKLRSIDTSGIHLSSLKWLKRELKACQSEDIVIVTHHAPSKLSLPLNFAEDILSAAYASDLDSEVKNSGARIWIHGHIHKQSDYKIGNTRVICNPRGYPDEPNQCFNPSLVIEI